MRGGTPYAYKDMLIKTSQAPDHPMWDSQHQLLKTCVYHIMQGLHLLHLLPLMGTMTPYLSFVVNCHFHFLVVISVFMTSTGFFPILVALIDTVERMDVIPHSLA